MLKAMRMAKRRVWTAGVSIPILLTATVWALPPSGSPPADGGERVTLSIVGTTDLHGYVFPVGGRGGLVQLGGYLRNLRAARAADGGAVLLLDAGDTFQGGIASNLSEGALVVDAYNALGYDALAIGNHEFEFGALDAAVGAERLDMRGALKAAAARARFPFLAANIIDMATGRPIAWPNVRPSTIVEAAGVAVGIVGVMTYDGLTKTLAANVEGLATVPLAPTVEIEARRLRARGAEVVVLLAHAGGSCARFDDPADLSSCHDTSEIFTLARQLTPGLVDAIVGGHSHRAVAHEVAGMPIVHAYSWGRAFARVDVTVVRGAGVVSARPFPPQVVCAAPCRAGDATPPSYESAPVTPDPSVAAAMRPMLARVDAWRATPLGVLVDRALVRQGDRLESPLGTLVADALRAAMPGVDAAIGLGARRGGLRADLPHGPVTRGALYETYPFDNRIATVAVTGAQLQRMLARVVARPRRGIPGVAGLHVRVACGGQTPEVRLLRSPSGPPIEAGETLRVATTDFFAARASRTVGARRVETTLATAPLVRDAVAAWVAMWTGRVRTDDLVGSPRWEVTDGGGLCHALTAGTVPRAAAPCVVIH